MGSLLVREIAIPPRSDVSWFSALVEKYGLADAIEALTYLSTVGLLVCNRPRLASACLILGLSFPTLLYGGLEWKHDHVAQMRSLTVRRAKAFTNHTHGLNAAERSLANDCIARLVGDPKRRYVLQMAARDQGCSGSHSVITSRDTGMAPRCDPLTSEHTLVLVDTDYYVDMNRVLRLGVPILLYTFSPLVPGGNHDGMTWSVHSPTHINASVSGGSPFCHQMWDYDRDYVSVYHNRRLLEYKVEARRISPTHILVLLQPRKCSQSWVPALLGLPTLFSPHRFAPLTRRVLAQTGTNAPGNRVTAANWVHSDGSVTVAALDRPYGVTLSARAVAALSSALANKAYSHLGVVSLLREEECAKSPTAVQIVQDNFLADVRHPTSFWKPMKPEEAEVTYTVEDAGNPQDQPRPSIVRLPVPEVAGVAVGPALSSAMAADCVDQRITAVNRQVVFPPKVKEYISMFVAAVVGDDAPLMPATVDYVNERLHKPAQRARTLAVSLEINNASAYPFEPLEVKAFQKREAYGSAKPARNISTVPQTHLIELARYTYPVYDYLKKFSWFGCGRTPYDTANLVTKLYPSLNFGVYETDFSKFDGTLTRGWQEMIGDIFKGLFRDPHPRRVVLRELTPRATNEAGPYNTRGSRLSGSPLTTIGNTLINACVTWIALCYGWDENFPPGNYANLLNRLGLYAGDDGLIPGYHPQSLIERAAAETGLQLKIVKRPSNSPCSFLGRYYLRPAQSAINMADLPRQLPKLAVTTDRQCTLKEALYHKALSWQITDYYTPIIGYWASAVLRILYDERIRTRVELLRYDARHYEADARLEPTYADCLPLVLAWYPECTERDIKEFERRCREARTLDELPTLVARGVSVDFPYRLVGDVLLSAAEHKQECKQLSSAPASSTSSRRPSSPRSPAASSSSSSRPARPPASGHGASSRGPATASTPAPSATTSLPSASRPSSSGQTTSSGTRTTSRSERRPSSSMQRITTRRRRDSSPSSTETESVYTATTSTPPRSVATATPPPWGPVVPGAADEAVRRWSLEDRANPEPARPASPARGTSPAFRVPTPERGAPGSGPDG